MAIILMSAQEPTVFTTFSGFDWSAPLRFQIPGRDGFDTTVGGDPSEGISIAVHLDAALGAKQGSVCHGLPSGGQVIVRIPVIEKFCGEDS
jgi:hypothetical protein